KMGGTAAVIVPSGVIQNSGKAFEAVRKMLIEKAELKAVIAMPSGVFKPYAGVSTAILIFTKGGETNNVWFYDMQADGYSLDDKRNKIAESDLQEIVEQYKTRLNYDSSDSMINVIEEKKNSKPAKENHSNHTNQINHSSDRRQKYFTVPKKEIVTNNYDLNLSTYKEEMYEEVKYDKPKLIFGKLETIEENIQTGLGELKQLL
ncbi:MAG: N-6 DNA methylase, partial [Bacteroidia bacterium]